MKRAALYIRRSTEEHQIESLNVQREEGARFIASKGWTLDPAHVFVDDAISRAEFKKRPGLLAMLNAAGAGRFDVVVARDETRLGGDTFRSGIVIQDILDAGGELHYYFTGERVRLDGAIEKFLVAARNFAAELEREKTAERTREHLLTKARRGLNVGGRVYGYDNIEIRDGERRVRVEYRVNPEQAAIVREMFTRYADGEGLRAIAKRLNLRGVPAPRAGKRGTGSWSPATIRAILHRERYAGVLTWGRMQKCYRGGTKVRVKRPACDLTVVQAPELQIIEPDLWARVRDREKGRASRSYKSRGAVPRYLLSGLARCGTCGGPMHVANAKVSYENVRVYVCAWHRDRGNAVCGNALRRPVEQVEAAVLTFIETAVLREELLLSALAEVRRRLSDRSLSTEEGELPGLEERARQLSGEIDRLASAIATSDAKPGALVRAIDERQAQLDEVTARIRTIRTAPAAISLELHRVEKEARDRLRDFAALVRRNPDEGRRVIESLIRSPLTFSPEQTPDGMRFRVTGELGLHSLFRTEGVPSGSYSVLNTAIPSVPVNLAA